MSASRFLGALARSRRNRVVLYQPLVRRHWKSLSGSYRFCTITEAKPVGESATSQTSVAEKLKPSENTQTWGLFAIKRMLKIGMFFAFFGGSWYYIDKNNVLLKWALQRLKDNTEKTDQIAQYMVMAFGYKHSHSPSRLIEFWPEIFELLDSKYPQDTQMSAIFLTGSLFNADPGVPNDVVWSKGLAKLRVLGGYTKHGGPEFLERLFERCVDLDKPQVMMSALELLVRMTQLPALPKERDVKSVVKTVKCSEEHAYSALLRYQDPRLAIQYLSEFPKTTLEKRPAFIPPFQDIKTILVKNRTLEFALQLRDQNNPMVQQYAQMVIWGIVGGYPDFDDLRTRLGDDEIENNRNTITVFETLLQLGQQHMMRDENHAAVLCFLDAQKLLPENSITGYLLGLCYKELGMFEEARNHLSEAVETKNSPDYRWELAKLLLKMNDEQDLEEALDILDGLLQIQAFTKKETAAFMFQVGCEKLGRYDDAFTAMRRLTKAGSKNSKTYYELGRLGNIVGEYEVADTALKIALDMEPFSTLYKLEKAQTLLALNNYDESQILCEEVIKSWPNDPTAWRVMSKIKSRKADWIGFIEAMDHIIQSKGHQPMHHFHKGKALQKLDRLEEALSSFEIAITKWLLMLQQRKIAVRTWFEQHPTDLNALEQIKEVISPGSTMEQKFNELLNYEPIN